MLQRAGIPFVLFERRAPAELTARPKAGLVEYRTVRLLREAGIGKSLLDFGTTNERCEFRTPTELAVIDYAALTGGRPHFIYPQHRLVRRLYAALEETGADLRSRHIVQAVRQGPGGVTLSGVREDGSVFDFGCEFVVGCEGSRSAVADAMTGLRVAEQRVPVRWLAAIGAAPPTENHTIYAAHPAGFAGQMRRGKRHTRYYLEVPADTCAESWPEQRIRSELSVRLGVNGQLNSVPFADVMFVDLRMRIMQPMQQGRLFLAGDAAHLITPAGGKGMNLAIQDAVELGYGLIDALGRTQDDKRLGGYSDQRLPAIWRTQAFSNWFLRILLAGLRDGGHGSFALGLRDGWVHALQEDPLLARWFAHAYAGVDQD